MDFVHDQLFDGRKIRILTVIDTFTRLSPAIYVRQQFRGAGVLATLEHGNWVPEENPGRSSSAESSIYGPLCACDARL